MQLRVSVRLGGTTFGVLWVEAEATALVLCSPLLKGTGAEFLESMQQASVAEIFGIAQLS